MSHPERLKQLQQLRQEAKAENKKQVILEAQRRSENATEDAKLAKKQAVAEEELLKLELGKEAYERKRAWDWTAEEAAAWDAKLEAKNKSRGEVAFADYAQEAAKAYERKIALLEKLTLLRLSWQEKWWLARVFREYNNYVDVRLPR